MSDSTVVDPEDVHIVDDLRYFPESETYDGLSQRLCTHFAEGSLVSEENPRYLGGVELITTEDGRYGYTGFAIDKENIETDWFQHRHTSEDNSDLEDLAMYLAQKVVDDRNTGSSSASWWAVIEDKDTASWYNVRLYWSTDTEKPPRSF